MNTIKQLKENGLLSEFVYLKLESIDFKKSFEANNSNSSIQAMG